MKRYLLVVPVLLAALTACSGGDPDTPEASPTPSADLKKVSERWNDMTWDEQAAVCSAAAGPLPGEGEIGGTATATSRPDYRLMLEAIEAAGYSQPEATAMIPYALNECR